ncbi:MAG: glycosyltransferase family 9 protein, partial [bacterium]
SSRQSRDELPGMPAVEEKIRPIALVPTAGEPSKEWPLDKWVDLAERLEAGGWHPLIFLGEMKARRKIGEMLRERQLAARNFCGSSLEGLFALVASCRLVIGPDSAPKHLAFASGVPTVTLYGSSEENRWRAMWDRRWHVELRACEAALSEEEKMGLAANHQIALISVDEVFGAAEKLLRKIR